MPLTDLVAPNAIVPALKVNGKKQAIQELSARAAKLTGQNERLIFETLMQREKLGSTGVGNGIAIPHGKLPKLEKLVGLFARLDRPIDFESLDGQPVDLIFLLLAPGRRPAPITSRRWRASRGCCASPRRWRGCASRATPTRSTPCWRCRPRKRRNARRRRDLTRQSDSCWRKSRSHKNRHREDRDACASGMLVATSVRIAAVIGCPAQAQYPNRPVTIIVPLAAGSGMDVLVRLYADKLSQSLGKPVVVENRPGASLMLAANAVAQAPPDGHTLLVSTSSAMAINLTLFKQVTYDPDRDFIPISLYVKSPFILVVNPDVPAKTVPELIKYIKENQGKLSYSSPGAGVAQHLSMEYMKNQFGLEITHVPYRSTPQSIQDIAAGHIALGWAEAGASIPLIKDGKLRALAVSSPRGCRCCPTCRRSPKPRPRRASRRCRGTCCSRRRKRRATSSTGCTPR